MTAPNEPAGMLPASEARPGAMDAETPAVGRPGRGRAIAHGVAAFLFWGGVQSVVAVPPAAVGTALGAVVGLGFLWWYVVRHDYTGERRRRATLRLRAPGPILAWVPLVLVLAVAFAAATLVLAARVLPLPRSDTFQYFERMPHGMIPLALLAVWLAPMMEEFLFRGWLQRNLERRLPAARAIVVTAVVFAAAHFDLFGFPSRFVVGTASGYLAWASGSIVPSVLLHAAYNGTLLLVDQLPGNLDDQALVRWARAPRVLAGAALLAMTSAAGLVWTLRRAGASAGAARGRRRITGPRL